MPAAEASKLIPKGNAVVLFSAKWCGHCKAMKKEWSAFDRKQRKRRGGVQVKTVDVAQLANSGLSVSGFPTIFAFRNGKKVGEFDSARTTGNFLRFAKTASHDVACASSSTVGGLSRGSGAPIAIHFSKSEITALLSFGPP